MYRKSVRIELKIFLRASAIDSLEPGSTGKKRATDEILKAQSANKLLF